MQLKRFKNSLNGKMTCDTCAEQLSVTRPADSDHCGYTWYGSTSQSRLLDCKNRGGLVIPSDTVYKVVKLAERVFQAVVVRGNAAHESKLMARLVSCAQHLALEDQPRSYFNSSCSPALGELPHGAQMFRLIVERYFVLRLKHFARVQNRKIHHDGSSRSRLSRLVIQMHH